MMVLDNVELDATVHGKQVSYRITQMISVAGVFSYFGDSVTNGLSNDMDNVSSVFISGCGSAVGRTEGVGLT